MSGIYWELRSHVLAITGAGFYAPDTYGFGYAIRCLACTYEIDATLIKVFWKAEESLRGSEVDLDHSVVLQSIAEHLRHDFEVSDHLLASAISLAGLADDVAAGIDLFCDQLGGRDRLCRDC